MIIAVDPGAKGAVAFFTPGAGMLEIIDMPVIEITRNGKTKSEISPQLLASVIRPRLEAATTPVSAIIEKVGAMPGQGVSSMFQFGRGVGMIEGVLATLHLTIHYVTPQQWQKAVGVRGGKDGGRARAVELFPAYASMFGRAKDDGRADAALIAWWGATR